mmetsp:Transcript_22365/g.39640  ORF Transcript_22365/g.39640 Transcript_22365/m.39640 type:complete len:504 (+) Transcript_22365:212-1723(+)
MISALGWVPRGAAREKPVRFEMGPEERATIERAKAKFEERMEDTDGLDRHGLPKELRMDDYGEEFDDVLWEDDGGEQVEASEAALSKMKSDTKEEKDGEEGLEDEDDEMNDEMDDVLDEEEDKGDDDFEDLGSDAEDFEVRESDRMALVAQTDEEFSNLEVYLYDQEVGSLYVHHDISLPAFPLCMAWIGCGHEIMGDVVTTSSKNFVGIGTFKPEIEIWNLDVLDVLEPTVTLKEDGHTDAVMGLGWNPRHPHLIASGSADTRCLLWDLTQAKVVKTFSHHSDKVQSVSWNPVESTVLLTGSFDKTLAVFDATTDGSNALRLKLNSDVECSSWNPHSPQQVLASTEDGKVTCFDVRNPGTPLYSFQAHEHKPCSSISISTLVNGLMATCSPDKSVKIWDLENANGPKCVASKSMSAGALFDVAFDVSEPYLLSAGGDKGLLAIWDLSEETNLARKFDSRIVGGSPYVSPNSQEIGDQSNSQPETVSESAPEAPEKKGSKKKN